jgi:hypothetical protein
MRRLLIALLVLVTSLLVDPAVATAQEATPTPAEVSAVTALSRTDTRYFVPFTPDGLNPSLNVTSTTEGACTFGSSIANSRPDAWGCTTEGGVVDPCFENPFVALDEATEVVCFDTPWSTDVVMVTLTAPLSREKEGPAGGMTGPADTADEVIQPWDLPWALELANGDRCSLLRGTLIPMAGLVVHYGCENQGLILGEVDRSQPVWVVSYVPEGESASGLVEVAVAYS